MFVPGAIFHFADFYVDLHTGESRGKFFVVIAVHGNGDVIVRLLTSQTAGRRQSPRCFHGDPYPAYFLGTLGNALTRPTWVDLRAQDDFDATDLGAVVANGRCHAVQSLASEETTAVMSCVASADDTTKWQEQTIRDELARRG